MRNRMRLNKYLAQCGVCSRRDADKLIEQGKVLVNGQVAGMGQQVEETDTVQVGKKILQGKQTQKVLAFYKPVGVTCTERDPHAEKKDHGYDPLSGTADLCGTSGQRFRRPDPAHQ